MERYKADPRGTAVRYISSEKGPAAYHIALLTVPLPSKASLGDGLRTRPAPYSCSHHFIRDNQGLHSNARCPPAFLSQVESAQERLLALAQFVLSFLPLVHWLSREGGTNVPTLTMVPIWGPL